MHGTFCKPFFWSMSQQNMFFRIYNFSKTWKKQAKYYNSCRLQAVISSQNVSFYVHSLYIKHQWNIHKGAHIT